MNSKPAKKTDQFFEDFPIPSVNQWESLAKELIDDFSGSNAQIHSAKPLYTRDDISGLGWTTSEPGSTPFVRGSKRAATSSRGWEITAEIPADTPDKINRALKREFDNGSTGAIIVPNASGETGLANLADMITALDGIDLTATEIHFATGASGLPRLGMLVAAAKHFQIPIKELRGSAASDPLGDMVTDGVHALGLDQAFDQMAAATEWAGVNAPHVGTIWVHGKPYNNGGADPAHELGYVIATAVEYLRQLDARGLTVEQTNQHFRFSFALGTQLFPEIAKLRAARLIWSRVLKECGILKQNEGMWIHAGTSRCSATSYDRHLNLLRTATESFAAIVGGANSITAAPLDCCTGPGNDMSLRLARNTQLILRDESHLAKVLDPAGGSWYLERLTADLTDSAWSLFQSIEKHGGMKRALADGVPQSELRQAAQEMARSYGTAEHVLVGINRYPNPDEALPPKTASMNTTGPVGPDHIEVIRPVRAAQPFEDVRSAVLRGHAAGTPLRAQFVNIGSTLASKRRSAVKKRGALKERGAFDASARSLLEIGGFQIDPASPDLTPGSGSLYDASIIVVCGFDEKITIDNKRINDAIRQISDTAPQAIIAIAGKPEDDSTRSDLEKAGVGVFLYDGCDIPDTLSMIIQKLGIKP